MSEDKPKIQIDSDWKKQAQAEKQRLAAEAEQQRVEAEAAAAPAGGPQAVGPEGLPPASFAEIVSTFASQIFMFLGEIPDPSTGQPMVNLPIAKHFIDLLEILGEKTKGNISDEEKRQIDQLLYEARMHYVQLTGGAIGRMPTRQQGGRGPLG